MRGADTNDVVLSEHTPAFPGSTRRAGRRRMAAAGPRLGPGRSWTARGSGIRGRFRPQKIRIGSTAVLRREDAEAPDVTLADRCVSPSRERDVLAALCRSGFSGDPFTEPASVRDIAEERRGREHLLRLYDKFGIHEEGERRRVRLANEGVAGRGQRGRPARPGRTRPAPDPAGRAAPRAASGTERARRSGSVPVASRTRYGSRGFRSGW